MYKFKDKISNMAAQMLGQAGKSCQFGLLDTMKINLVIPFVFRSSEGKTVTVFPVEMHQLQSSQLRCTSYTSFTAITCSDCI